MRNDFLGMVAFVNTTTIANRQAGEQLFDNFATGGGAGLRLLLNKRSRTNLLAFDVGFGEKREPWRIPHAQRHSRLNTHFGLTALTSVSSSAVKIHHEDTKVTKEVLNDFVSLVSFVVDDPYRIRTP